MTTVPSRRNKEMATASSMRPITTMEKAMMVKAMKEIVMMEKVMMEAATTGKRRSKNSIKFKVRVMMTMTKTVPTAETEIRRRREKSRLLSRNSRQSPKSVVGR